MTVDIHPVDRLASPGEAVEFVMPPDKSVFHRILFIGSLTQTAFTIPIPSPQAISHDIVATVLALESIGVPVELFPDRVELQGVGRFGYRMPTHLINCANSGTTARLLMGLLAGQQFNCALTGDDSLSVRPMKRLANLLSQLGAQLVTAPEGTLPLMINGRRLHGADVTLPVASAQMKSAILLAGLHAEGVTSVTEPSQSRDHTERMLEAFGFGLEWDEDRISIDPSVAPALDDEILYTVPGDISSAAFLIVAAVLLKRRITIRGVLINPTRSRFLDILTLMGVVMESTNITTQWGEDRGDLTVFADACDGLLPFSIDASDVPLLIDELPVLMILAAFAEGESAVHGAGELRHKESDRLGLTSRQLQAFGVEVLEHADGISIHGIADRQLHSCEVVHGSDHRLAMSFSIAALFCNDAVRIEESEAVSISYPEFYEHLATLAGVSHVQVRGGRHAA
jgi:3-phosphoshikimate 1-carboxyvinyltransferase